MATEYPMPTGFGRDAVDEPGVVITPSGAVMFKLGTAPPPDDQLGGGYISFYFNPDSFAIEMRANLGSFESPDYNTQQLMSD